MWGLRVEDSKTHGVGIMRAAKRPCQNCFVPRISILDEGFKHATSRPARRFEYTTCWAVRAQEHEGNEADNYMIRRARLLVC